MANGKKDFGVVLAAAGSGTRFGGKKQLLLLGGKPLWTHSLTTLASTPGVGYVVIVVAPSDVESFSKDFRDELKSDSVGIAAGGASRQESVLNGLRALPSECEFVLVHDAARPLVTADEVQRVLSSVRKDGAAVLGYPATDSIKESSDKKTVRRNLQRETVWLVQTPQGSRTGVLISALEEGIRDDFVGTDEASFLERRGVPVTLVEGSRENIKVTYPDDLELAEFFLKRRARNPESGRR